MYQIIIGFFQSKSSMMRLCLLIATVCLWGPYAYTFIATQKAPVMDREVVMAYGFLVGGKAAQAYVERKYSINDVDNAPKI